MADTPEAKVKKQVRKLLDDLPAYYFFPATHGYGRSGIPDIIFCYKGVFGAIECKAGKGQLTALQEREIKWIEDHAGFTFVARETNLEELKEKLIWMTKKISSGE